MNTSTAPSLPAIQHQCCLKHTSKFCPECGKRIPLRGDVVGARLLVRLEASVTRIKTLLQRPNIANDPHLTQHHQRSLEAAEASAKWVRERLGRNHTSEVSMATDTRGAA